MPPAVNHTYIAGDRVTGAPNVTSFDTISITPLDGDIHLYVVWFRSHWNSPQGGPPLPYDHLDPSNPAYGKPLITGLGLSWSVPVFPGLDPTYAGQALSGIFSGTELVGAQCAVGAASVGVLHFDFDDRQQTDWVWALVAYDNVPTGNNGTDAFIQAKRDTGQPQTFPNAISLSTNGVAAFTSFDAGATPTAPMQILGNPDDLSDAHHILRNDPTQPAPQTVSMPPTVSHIHMAEIGYTELPPTSSPLTEDYWAWVEPDFQSTNVEPGLYAAQSRPALATGQEPTLGITTFYTDMPTIALAFNTAVNGVGYDLNNNFYGEGAVGNWTRNKDAICYLYHERNDFLFPEEGESWWVGWVDTSYRPLPTPDDHPFNLGSIFVNHQNYFWITGADLTVPRMVRYVPPYGNEICFLANSTDDIYPDIFRNIYFIPANTGSPTITNIMTADDLHTGAREILYFSFSADGRWLAAQVDDRLVIYDRDSSSVVLDVVENASLPYQFSDNAGMLYYTKNGVLNIRRWIDGWALNEISTVSTSYTCGGFPAEAGWILARYSPNSEYWYNGWEGGCGGVFDHEYRNMSCIMDTNFFPISECQVGGGFTLGIPFGDFSNDSRWYVGGDGNINGGSKAILGVAPTWEQGIRQSASAGVQMRSFQPF